MEHIVRELCEDFLMSKVCSEFYAMEGQETEAQDLGLYLRYMEHAQQCEEAAQTCHEYLINKNFELLLCKLNRLELTNCTIYLSKMYEKL